MKGSQRLVTMRSKEYLFSPVRGRKGRRRVEAAHTSELNAISIYSKQVPTHHTRIDLCARFVSLSFWLNYWPCRSNNNYSKHPSTQTDRLIAEIFLTATVSLFAVTLIPFLLLQYHRNEIAASIMDSGQLLDMGHYPRLFLGASSTTAAPSTRTLPEFTKTTTTSSSIFDSETIIFSPFSANSCSCIFNLLFFIECCNWFVGQLIQHQ